MRKIYYKIFYLVAFSLFLNVNLLSKNNNPPPPNGAGFDDSVVVGGAIDDQIFLLLIAGLLFGIWYLNKYFLEQKNIR